MGHIAHVGSDGTKAFGSEFQPVVERVGLVHPLQVFCITGKQFVGRGFNCIGHSPEHSISLLVGEQCQLPAGLLCTFKSICKVHRGINSV